MHIGKSYKLPEFLAWTRRTIYVLGETHVPMPTRLAGDIAV